MTGYELRDTVAALGFDSAVPDDGGFFKAANLAMMRLRTLIPVEKAIEPLSYDTLGSELGIDPCLSEAAVLLTAYYVWIEDDKDKAGAYRAEYDYAVAQIMRRRKVDSPAVVTNNW